MASIASIFRTGAQQIRQAFGDVFEQCAHVAHLSAPTYTPSSNAIASYASTATTGVYMGFVDYKTEERAARNIPPDVQRVLLVALDAPGLVPKPGDLIRRADNVRVYVIVDVQDAGGIGALYDMQTRQASEAWPL